MSTENGQNVLLNVEVREVLKPEPGVVITLLQLTAGLIVRTNSQKLSHAILILVQVMINIHEQK